MTYTVEIKKSTESGIEGEVEIVYRQTFGEDFDLPRLIAAVVRSRLPRVVHPVAQTADDIARAAEERMRRARERKA